MKFYQGKEKNALLNRVLKTGEEIKMVKEIYICGEDLYFLYEDCDDDRVDFFNNICYNNIRKDKEEDNPFLKGIIFDFEK